MQVFIPWPYLRAGLLAILLTPIGTVAAAAVGVGAAPGTSAQPAGYTNRLIDSNDPYLLLHAHNPVDWYPWGPEALAKARREDKPIFVSIGYSTCYWCHVAERTIYSDPAIAKLMNEWFVNVKVDREQRPDIDRIYMLATQTLVGRGGWPNNVFLTPDLKPFFAGSYFPPDDAPGRPGFATILKQIHAAWSAQKAQIQQHADRTYAAMLSAQQQAAEAPAAIAPGAWLTGARDELLRSYDAANGGLGGGRTKFPRSPALELLLVKARAAQDPKALEVLTRTLDAMALGGIRDHLSGGFHRYSTEPTWSIPHFEKMLYDNAQLLKIYAQAYELTGNPLYQQVAEEVTAYLTQQMMAPGGGFYAAQDAEVDGREGVSYLWSGEEIEAILGKEAAERFLQVYSLTPMPEQSDDSLLSGAQKGVLRARLPATAGAQPPGRAIARALASQAAARAKLLAARNLRPQPARDEKIIVAWNAMAIDAMVRSGELLGDSDSIAFAKQAAARLWTLAYDPSSGELKHEIYGGRAQTHGYLDDYALLGVGFLTLHAATGDSTWRDRAAALAAAMLERFSTAGALTTTVASSDLLIPLQDDGDNTAPSGTSAALELLARLYEVTGKEEYARAGVQILSRLSGSIGQNPALWPSAVAAINRHPLPAGMEAERRNAQVGDSEQRGPPSTANHVHARGEVRRASDHDEITVTMVVDKGYHVNANPATFDYLIPTALSVEGVSDLRVTYPAGTLFKPQFAPDGLKVYEGTITLNGIAPKGSLALRKPIAAALRVQACNDQVCLPPATLPIDVKRK
jgi:uncharacterized protein